VVVENLGDLLANQGIVDKCGRYGRMGFTRVLYIGLCIRVIIIGEILSHNPALLLNINCQLRLTEYRKFTTVSSPSTSLQEQR
jgi:hypothetical protein